MSDRSSPERLQLPIIGSGKKSQNELNPHLNEKSVPLQYTDESDIMQQLADMKYLLEEETRVRIEMQENIQKMTKRYDTLEKAIKNNFKIMTPVVSTVENDRSMDMLNDNSLRLQSGEIPPWMNIQQKLLSLQEDVLKLSNGLETSKQMNERVALALSDAISMQSKDIMELKSVISAEITARRKFQGKTNGIIQQMVSEHEHDTFSLRKEILHVSESLGSRFSSAESSATIHRETLIAQIADSRNYLTDSLNQIRNEVEMMKRNQRDSNLEESIRIELKSLDERIRQYAPISNKIESVSGELSHVSSVVSQLRLKQDEYEHNIVSRPPNHQINTDIQQIITQKFTQQDKKLRRTFEQIFKDISDEIALCVQMESNSRNQELLALENRLIQSIDHRFNDFLSRAPRGIYHEYVDGGNDSSNDSNIDSNNNVLLDPMIPSDEQTMFESSYSSNPENPLENTYTIGPVEHVPLNIEKEQAISPSYGKVISPKERIYSEPQYSLDHPIESSLSTKHSPTLRMNDFLDDHNSRNDGDYKESNINILSVHQSLEMDNDSVNIQSVSEENQTHSHIPDIKNSHDNDNHYDSLDASTDDNLWMHSSVDIDDLDSKEFSREVDAPIVSPRPPLHLIDDIHGSNNSNNDDAPFSNQQEKQHPSPPHELSLDNNDHSDSLRSNDKMKALTDQKVDKTNEDDVTTDSKTVESVTPTIEQRDEKHVHPMEEKMKIATIATIPIDTEDSHSDRSNETTEEDEKALSIKLSSQSVIEKLLSDVQSMILLGKEEHVDKKNTENKSESHHPDDHDSNRAINSPSFIPQNTNHQDNDNTIEEIEEHSMIKQSSRLMVKNVLDNAINSIIDKNG